MSHWRISDDGATVVRTTSMDTPSDPVTIGFFSAQGEQRAVVAGHHAGIRLALTNSGHAIVLGFVQGQTGFYLTRYDPSGKRLWERLVGGDPIREGVSMLALSPDGQRIALRVMVWLDRQAGKREESVLLLNGEGKDVARGRLPDQQGITGLDFAGDGRLLAMTSTDGVTLLDSVTGRQRWHNAGLGLVAAEADAAALGANEQELALLVRVQADPGAPQFGVLVLNARNGQLIDRYSLPADYRVPSSAGPRLRYDAMQRRYLAKDHRGGERPAILADGKDGRQ